MTANRAAELWKIVRPPDAPDAALLARFAAGRDADAFRELLRRHGPLVLGACRRVAGHAQDAEDAFQAVFLILARKAAAVRRPEVLGNWLYGVAVRVARRAKRSAARRRKREVQVRIMPDPPGPESDARADLAPVLDAELAALPAWYRDAVLLCDLQGLSRAEAAERLGVPEGTLSSRLASGRKKMADRLAKRGITLSAAALASIVSETGLAAVPVGLTETVVERVVGGVVPGAVAQLAREGAWAMRAKLMLIAAAGALAAGWAALAGPNDPPKPADPPPKVEAKPAPEMPAEKAVEFTDRPRMVQAVDIPLSHVKTVAWTPDGKRLAAQGKQTRAQGPSANVLILIDANELRQIPVARELQDDTDLVGFEPCSGEPVTALRESKLISGRHQLLYLIPPKPRPISPGSPPPLGTARVVPLGDDDSMQIRFSPDGRSIRVVARDPAGPGKGNWLEVREIDAATGQTMKIFPRVEVKWQGFDLSPDGRELATFDHQFAITLWDAGRGARKWTATPMQPTEPHGWLTLSFSPDGRRLSVGGAADVAAVYDAASGEQIFAVENKGETTFGASKATFSADGRLVAWGGHERTQRNAIGRPGRGAPPGIGALSAPTYSSAIQVWDVDRKKLLKSWNGAADIAFAPDRPLLAILEPRSEGKTRLGFWDFAAAK
jgi:RNA polymerase sigma factor (sigma-70 family)